MNKYLLFRTDRIGDFIFSNIIIQSIKEKSKNNKIDVVCSKYNSKYIREYKDVNNVYILDKYNLSSLVKKWEKTGALKTLLELDK